jgi:hypothetical protein
LEHSTGVISDEEAEEWIAERDLERRSIKHDHGSVDLSGDDTYVYSSPDATEEERQALFANYDAEAVRNDIMATAGSWADMPEELIIDLLDRERQPIPSIAEGPSEFTYNGPRATEEETRALFARPRRAVSPEELEAAFGSWADMDDAVIADLLRLDGIDNLDEYQYQSPKATEEETAALFANYDPEAVRADLNATAGSWADVDEAIIAQLDRSLQHQAALPR